VKFEVMTAVSMQTNPVGCDHDGCIPLLHSPSQLSTQTVTHRNKCLADVALRLLVDMY
jgi:histone acetyltransferase (RNA polymerase elongator complex component)